MYRNCLAQRVSKLTIGLVLLLSAIGGNATDTNPDFVNRAVDVARSLYSSGNFYDQILGAGTLSDIGDREALSLLEEDAKADPTWFTSGPQSIR